MYNLRLHSNVNRTQCEESTVLMIIIHLVNRSIYLLYFSLVYSNISSKWIISKYTRNLLHLKSTQHTTII